MFEDWTNCHECEHNPTGDKCELFGRVIGMHGCSSGVERKPRNHFEMLKSMSMEEMAAFLGSVMDGGYGRCPDGYSDCSNRESCAECWTEWLKEEITDA